MKKIIAILLALLCLVSVASAEGSIVISGTDSGALELGVATKIDKVCELTVNSLTVGEYAMSINAYNRPDDELFVTGEIDAVNCRGDYNSNKWRDYERYKYEANGDIQSYAFMYTDIGAALRASVVETELLDIRLDVLNLMMLPMNVNDKISMKLIYGDGYEFEATYLRMEQNDTADNPNEWLCELTDIPMLMKRTVHVVFEVPELVVTGSEPLKAVFTVDGVDYEFTIR